MEVESWTELADTGIMSPSSTNRRSFRSVSSAVADRFKRHDGARADRNTSPTDFVLRDYRYVR